MIPSLATRAVMALALFALSLSTQAACTIEEWAASKGAVAAVPEANYYGDCGLRVDLDGQSAYVEGAAYVEDQTPGNVTPPVTEYAARFYIDASNVTKVGDPAELVIFQGWRTDGTEAFSVKFAICDGVPVVSGHIFDTSTENISLPAGWQEITVFWRQDGTLRLRVAGVGEDTLAGPATTLALDSDRLGVATGTLRLFSGYLHFDEFASTRGDDPGPKVNVCSGQHVALKDFVFDSEAPALCSAETMKFDNVLMKSGGEYNVETTTFSAARFSVETGAVFRLKTAATF